MKKLTVIILSLVLSFGVVGCSSNSKDDSTQEKQEQQKDTAATASEISTLLKDMYIVLKDSNGGTKDCKDKLVNYGKDINDAMLENKEYGQDMQNLKDATEDYDLEKIAKYVCDILNDIEGSDKYSIEIVIKILSQMGIIKRVQIQIKTTIITKIRIKITKKNIKVGTTEIIQNVQTAKK